MAHRIPEVLLAGLIFSTPLLAQSPLEQYRRLEFPAEPSNDEPGFAALAPGWQARVAAEFAVINHADPDSLRAGLLDRDKHVRAIAARALGIRAEKKSAEALAKLAQEDPEAMVRIRAVESLGLLKMKLDVIEHVKKNDKHAGVTWAADLAIDQLKSDLDCGAQIRRSFARGIKRSEMAVAKVGQPAPDFTAQTLDGKLFKLSSVLGKKPIAIYFAGFDQ